MKKVLSFVLVLALALSFVACGTATSTPASSPASNPASQPASEPASEPAAATGALKTGMGIAASGAVKGEASEDGDGSVQSNSTVAVVTVDADGKIVECIIDVAQTSTTFAMDGTVQDATKVDVRTKMEKGPDYGMLPASPIGKEWNDQANAFAAYVVGKTADEVTAIAQLGADAHNGPADADLAAGCTMDITDMKAAVATAVANAKEMGANAGDTLGLGVVTDVSATAASEDGDGKIQHDTTFAVVTKAADGKISSSFLNVTQTKYTVTAEGVAECTTATVTPKYEQGDDYKMKGASPIGKEWFEQADAFNAYIIGKTGAEVEALAQLGADAHNGPADADLAAGCTMDITDMKAASVKAAA